MAANHQTAAALRQLRAENRPRYPGYPALPRRLSQEISAARSGAQRARLGLRIKSLSGARSPGFVGVRAAGQTDSSSGRWIAITAWTSSRSSRFPSRPRADDHTGLISDRASRWGVSPGDVARGIRPPQAQVGLRPLRSIAAVGQDGVPREVAPSVPPETGRPVKTTSPPSFQSAGASLAYGWQDLPFRAPDAYRHSQKADRGFCWSGRALARNCSG